MAPRFAATTMNREPMKPFEFEEYGTAFFDASLHRLRALISAQSDKLFNEMGISVPSLCASMVLHLDENKGSAVVALANALGYSHQLIQKRILILKRLKCISRRKDRGDKRRSIIELTDVGRKEAALIRIALKKIDSQLSLVFDEVGCDGQAHVQSIHERLVDNPISNDRK